MQDMQANLKETGMSGTMYRREDLAGMMDKMKDMVSDLTPRDRRAIRARNSRRNSLSSAPSPAAVPRGRPGDGDGR